MKIQIVEGDGYLEKSLTITSETQVVDVPRGEIVDALGRPLVSNKSCFNVIADKAFFPSDNNERNRIILETAAILSEEGTSWNDDLPMSWEMPFTLNEAMEEEAESFRKHIGVQVYATPDECLSAMCDNYGISRDYSPFEQRVIAGIRYTMDIHSFSVANTYTFAEDVSMDTVIRIKEASFRLDGIDIREAAARTYGDGDVCPHLIGTVGAISAEEYAELKGRGYAIDDTVGKSGIELAMESVLRGKQGVKTIEMQDGVTVSVKLTEEAVPGNTVKLTIDSNYQRKVQTILENHITWLRTRTGTDDAGRFADAGAIVVLDVKTGALRAAATAPTYNLNDYINDYSSVVSGENSPLTNRAVNGLYRPGSTFKTVTATAALNEGIITPDTQIRCNNVYDYWDDFKPKCTGTHGLIDVIAALRESCNIFFYETGRISGIDTVSEYAGMFGLGEEAGLETGRGIKRGYVACPETYNSLGLDWQMGDTVQAAIGQSETAITPLQMAAQAMTIANKGVRYQTYMVDSVYTYNMEELVSKTEPVIAQVIPDKTGYTFDTVTEGMKQAADFDEYTYPKPRESDYYTGSYLLSALPYDAAIKTGTPQKTSDDTSSAFIGFYPADDPEIAFAGYVEHGEYSKFMIRSIIEAYYEDYTPEKLEDTSEHTVTEAEEFTETSFISEETEPYVPETSVYYETETESQTEPETVTVTSPPETTKEKLPESETSALIETEQTATESLSETETESETATPYTETSGTASPPPDKPPATETETSSTSPTPDEETSLLPESISEDGGGETDE